jgi:tetratricopeptide (TPR) repeat protein
MVRQGSFDPKKVEKLTVGIIHDRNTQKEYRAMAYYYDAYAKSVQGRTEQALKSAGELTKIDAFQGHFISGTIYFDTKQYPAARAELQQADKIRPGTRQVRELLQQIPVQ